MSVEKCEGEDAKTMRPVSIHHIAGLLYGMHGSADHASNIAATILSNLSIRHPPGITILGNLDWIKTRYIYRVTSAKRWRRFTLFMAVALANPEGPQNPCRR
jgi:hypothetical protein